MSDLVDELAGNQQSIDLTQVIDRLKAGETFDAITLIPPSAGGAIALPPGVSARLVWRVGDDLVLVMPDRMVVLEGAAVSPTLVRAGAMVYLSNELAADAPVMNGPIDRSLFEQQSLRELYDQIAASAPGGSGEAEGPGVQPLVGLDINPLLPPTAFTFPGFEEELFGAAADGEGLLGAGDGGGIGPVGIEIETDDGPPILAETDGPLDWTLSDDLNVGTANAGQGEEITQVSIEIANLPAGMLASSGSFATEADGTLTFTFTGTLTQFQGLSLTFPTDFSTESRIDAAPGDLEIVIGVQSNFTLGETVTDTVPLTISAEADLVINGSGVLNGIETDAPVTLQPSTVLLPAATDIDGSEFVTGVTFTLSGLPVDTIIDINGVQTTVTGNFSFTGSLADYSALLVIFPADFSTENPQTEITGTLTATTNEGGLLSRDLSIVIDFTADITLIVTDPAPVTEDQDMPGVLVDLDPSITIDDQDLSENGATDLPPFGTVVTVSFAGLPATGAEARYLGTSVAITDATVLSLSVAEARDLAVFLPEDFNTGINDDAPLTVSYLVTTPEGSETASQNVLVRPTLDISFDINPIESRETDAELPIIPSASWVVSVTDPNESITNVTLTLDNLPPGMVFDGAPATTITYDPVLGGTMTFSGTLADYTALRLIFPTDFSTENRDREDLGSGPGYPAGPITGTISATSTESGSAPTGGPAPILEIADEGDVGILTLTPATLTEDNGAAPGVGETVAVRLDSYLVPGATDRDLSESLEQLVVVVTGLPGAGSFALSDILIEGLPATLGALTTAADGSQTYSLTLTGADVGKYIGLTLNLPDNFSTENRSDLVGTPTTLPIALELTATTNEGDPAENTTTATATITVAAEHDITLTADAEPTADEDSAPGGGAVVDLMIDISVLDTDLSENPATGADPRFATQVFIDYGLGNLPLGVTFNTGSYNPVTGRWTGTVADAEALSVGFPPDHNGTHLSVITVRTPEGEVTFPQKIVINPIPDITLPDTITTAETDAAVPVLLSDSLDLGVIIRPTTEGLVSFEFTLTGLPAGTTVSAPPTPEYVIDPIPPGADPVTVRYVYTAADPFNAAPFDVTITLPKDYSTESPAVTLVANTLTVSTDSMGIPQADQIQLVVTDEEDLVFIEPLTDNSIQINETDAEISFKPSDAIIATAKVEPGAPADGVPNPDQDGSESVTEISVTITGLPAGATAVSSIIPAPGSLTQPAAGTFVFVGTRAEYESISITLPRDFSTVSPATTISGTVRAITNEGGDDTRGFTVEVQAEGDVRINTKPFADLTEDNVTVPGGAETPVSFTPADLLDPQVSLGGAPQPGNIDEDGSESLQTLTLTVDGLPSNFDYPGAVSGVPLDGSNPLISAAGSFQPDGGTAGSGLLSLTLTRVPGGPTLEDIYRGISVQVPLDFSTTNRTDLDGGATAQPITVTLSVETDENIAPAGGEGGGTATSSASFDIVETQDIDVDAPRSFTVDEDADGSGVEIALAPLIVIGDVDGSEDGATDAAPFGTTVAVSFTGLPATGTEVRIGTTVTLVTNATILTLDVADANALRLFLPADFNTGGNPPVTVAFDVTTPEGTDSTTRTITVTPGPDIDFSVTPIVTQETDTTIEITPATAWQASIPPSSAAQGEVLLRIDLTLDNLPSGVLINSVGGTITYDAVNGGAFSFSGTPAEYAALSLVFPRDFSTDSRAGEVPVAFPPGALTGTFAATSTDGSATSPDTPSLQITPEGDIFLESSTPILLAENDPVGNDDQDSTTTAPVQFLVRDSMRGVATDFDMSETMVRVDNFTVTGLPDGSSFSLTGAGGPFTTVPGTPPALTFATLTAAQFDQLVIRLPDDFSTESPGDNDNGPISGSARFFTDEAIAAGETAPTPTNGVVDGSFTVTVSDEADIRITTANVSGVEDLVTVAAPLALNLDSETIDIDNSEVLTALSVTFDGLPAGGIVLSDGTLLTPASNVWTPTGSPADAGRAQLQALAITTFPVHYSGQITATVSATSNEGVPASESFLIDITPVAEPTITLSVDDSAANVTRDPAAGPDTFSVKEDTSALLTIDASTPDTDGSEQLTQIVLENLPAGWLPDGDVTGFFEGASGKIASAVKAGTTVTITLTPGVTDISELVRVSPSRNDDRDVETIVGADLVATVTAVDSAPDIPASDTAVAVDDTDLDVDAVVDGISLRVTNENQDEIITTQRVQLDVNRLNLIDQDRAYVTRGQEWSETFDRIELTFSVTTATAGFDPRDPNDLRLIATRNSGDIEIVLAPVQPADPTQVSYIVRPSAAALRNDFPNAVESLTFEVAGRVSLQIETNGTIFWNETTTPTTFPGDRELDTSDNFAQRDFGPIRATINPVAEAAMTVSVFVADTDFVVPGTETIISEALQTGPTTQPASVGRLALLESTADGTGEGPVTAYAGINASTPDIDGSERLETFTVANIPTDWLRNDLDVNGTTVLQSAFFSNDPANPLPITAAEWAKIASAEFDPATGTLTLTFVPGVTSFDAAFRLTPTLYEDNNVNSTDPEQNFPTVGTFFPGDLGFGLTVIDTDNVPGTDDSAQLVASLNVDVAPVNNTSFIISTIEGRESVIDGEEPDAGGVLLDPGTFKTGITLGTTDQDGSETIISTVLKDVPQNITVFVLSDPSDPNSARVPALLENVNDPPGFNSWSLQNGEWNDIELRGIARHTSGTFDTEIDIVTKEANGGTGTTTLPLTFTIAPVIDGGNPSESVRGFEDNLVKIAIDGNPIDNINNSPGSPEKLIDQVELFNIPTDRFGRTPEFYILDPVTGDPDDPSTWGPPIGVTGGVLDRPLTPDEALNLYMRPGQDSNIDLSFQVSVRYVEEIAESPPFAPPTPPDQITPAGSPVIGTITVDMIGVADDPIPEAQIADPNDPNNGVLNPITRDQVNDIYKPATGPGSDGELAFSYVGWDSEVSFALDLRLTSGSLLSSTTPGPVNRNSPDPTVAADAKDLGALFTEQMFPDPAGGGGTVFDGSESLFYVIRGIDPTAGYSFIGGEPVDPTGTTLLFTSSGLANLQFVPGPNAQLAPIYYEFTLDAIVVEDDFTLSDGIGITQAQFDALTPAEKFIVLKSPAEPGVAIESTDFSVMILPDGGGGPTPPCDPDDPEFLTPPTFEFVPVGAQLEDRNNEYRIQLAPDAKWSDLNDIITLPAGVVGSLGVAINLPPGGSISANPPGAILLDPVSGLYVVDFAALGVDPTDPTITAGSIFFTPPANQSSPPGFPSGTFGDMPPYDGLDTLEYVVGLDNITCPNSSFFVTQDFFLNIEPVADGPRITIPTQATDEDISIANLLEITGIDPGERPVGDVIIAFDLTVPNPIPGSSDPEPILSIGGVDLPFTDAGGTRTYTLTAAQAETATLSTREHFSGNVTFTVQATSEDVDFSTKTNTVNGSIEIIPVADTPVVAFDTAAVGPDGVPLVSFPDGPGNPPTLTAIEDLPFTLADAVSAASPDTDGSEIGSVVLGGVPDYLTVTLSGGGSAGLIDNGDGTFTIDPAVFDDVVLQLADPHARTPDALDPTIPDVIPLTIRSNTLELGNSDEARSADVPFNLRVRPEADLPTAEAFVLPPTGSEDQPDPYTLTIRGITPDPHETMEFTISGMPDGSILSVGGTDFTVGPSGSLTVPGVPTTGPTTGLGSVFEPASPVLLTPPEHFSGQINLDITATTIDSSIDPSFPFTSTDTSAPAMVMIDIAATPDLEVDFTPPVDLFEDGPGGGDTGLDYQPAADTTFTVRDTDGSEFLNQVVFTLQNVPAGMTASAPAGGTVTIAGGVLTFTSTIGASAQAEYDALVLNFPADYSTTGLTGTVRGTTNEGGDETAPVSLAITPTPDIDITVLNPSVEIPESGSGALYEPAADFTIAITDMDGSEFVQQITYTLQVPAGTTAVAPSGGTVAIAGGVLTFTSDTATAAGQAQAEFDALQVTFPAGFSSGGPLDANLSVISNETLAFPPEQATNTVTVIEVPEVTVDIDDAVVLTETDAEVDYKPADASTITVNDSDGSEFLTSVTYTLAGIPPGLSVIGGNAFVTIVGDTLTFTSSSADPLGDFQTLEVAFPADFASNGVLMTQTLNATTNEGGDATDSGTLNMLGTPDVDLTVTPVDAAQTGAALGLDLGIDTEITPASNVWETFDEVEISFDAPLDAAITPSNGVLSADRRTLTLERAPAQSNADFTLAVAALVLTAEGSFADTIDGTIIGRSDHGDSAAEPFSLRVNDQPDVSGPAILDPVSSASPTVTVPITEFLTTATDPDQPLRILTDPTTDQADVTAQVQGDDIVFTIANGYTGPVTVSYTITDSPAGGVPAASIDATADLQLLPPTPLSFTTGLSVIGPGGRPIPLADDATGTAGVTDILVGSTKGDAVVVTTNYTEVEGFSLLGGRDLVDLSGASANRGFTVDLGNGNDEGRGGGGNDIFVGGQGRDVIDGAGGNDVIDGGAGADQLTGGAGADQFVLSGDLAITDVISDYDLTEGDQIDLSAVLTGEDGINGRASYDVATGNLTVQGDIAAQLNPGGALPASVEVIFENAAGDQATAVI